MSLELELEKLLKIKTSGRDDSNSNLTNYPYEATSYSILQSLAQSGYITKKDKIIDFGCGKGRVDFYLAYFTKATMIGVEFDLRLFNRAMDNHKTSICSSRVNFINSCASKLAIDIDVSGAYFFNPFSILILKQVLDNFRISQKEKNRKIKLFFYYPSNEYLSILDHEDDIIHLEDIDCKSLFKKDDRREYIAIYELIEK